jgi:RNA polymerase sigma factor (sigma-70 family)
MEIELIENLKKEDNKAIAFVYKKHFSMVKRFIINNNGSVEDAEDVFQEMMIVLLQKLRTSNFEVTASLKTYVMAIAKYMWLNRLRQAKTYKRVDFSDQLNHKFYEEIDSAIEDENKFNSKIQYYISQITDHCKSLIDFIFFKEKTIEEVQSEFGYSSKHNAQNQKYKCVEQLRKAMKEEK